MSSVPHHTAVSLSHWLPWPLNELADVDQDAPLDVDLSNAYIPLADQIASLALALHIALTNAHREEADPADFIESARVLQEYTRMLTHGLHAWDRRPFADRLKDITEAHRARERDGLPERFLTSERGDA